MEKNFVKFYFLQFQKWPKINFWTGKKFKTAKNAVSRNNFWIIFWFHKFFSLDFFKFSGPLWYREARGNLRRGRALRNALHYFTENVQTGYCTLGNLIYWFFYVLYAIIQQSKFYNVHLCNLCRCSYIT